VRRAASDHPSVPYRPRQATQTGGPTISPRRSWRPEGSHWGWGGPDKRNAFDRSFPDNAGRLRSHGALERRRLVVERQIQRIAAHRGLGRRLKACDAGAIAFRVDAPSISSPSQHAREASVADGAGAVLTLAPASRVNGSSRRTRRQRLGLLPRTRSQAERIRRSFRKAAPCPTSTALADNSMR
jgi:hypothetical protein